MSGDRFQGSQITITRHERQRREALQRRYRRASREPVIGSLLLIVLLLCAAVMLYACLLYTSRCV